MNKYNLILLVLLVASCNPGHYKRIRVDSGVNYGESNHSLLFPRSSIGLRGGVTVKDSIPWGGGKGWGLFNALCWRTVDGGHNWTSQKITDGTFQDLIMKDDIVYAVIYSGGGDDEKFQCKIYDSMDFGETWRLKCTMDEGILWVHVIDSNRIIGDIEGKLGETRDGGKTWNTLPTRYFTHRNFYHDKYAYYFSSSKNNVVTDILGRKNLETGEERIITFPDGFSGKNGKNNLVFCSKDKELRAYRINDDFTLTYLSSIKREKILGVDYVGIYNKHIFIFVNFIDPGIFWNEDSFYYSANDGKSWKRLGHKGLTTGGWDRITDYTDSTGFKVIFYKDIYSLGTFSVPAGK